jgi:hypothetical protein
LADVINVDYFDRLANGASLELGQLFARVFFGALAIRRFSHVGHFFIK